MAISHAEFLRSIAPLQKHYRYSVDEARRRIVLNDGSRRVEILLGPETSRRLGALKMPSMNVQLSYYGFAEDELARFRSRFDLCFRRGGG